MGHDVTGTELRKAAYGMDPLTASLMGVSTVSGIAGALGGSRSAKKRQRAIARAHRNHYNVNQRISNNLATQLQGLAQQRDQANLQYQQALNSSERAESIGRAQGEAQAGMESAIVNMMHQGTQRSGAAKGEAEGQAGETGMSRQLIQDMFDAQAQQQQASQFAMDQAPVLEQLRMMQQGGNVQTMAGFEGAQNDLQLQQTLGGIASKPMQNDFTQLMNIVSPVAGTGAVLSSMFPGAPSPGVDPTSGPGMMRGGDAPILPPGLAPTQTTMPGMQSNMMNQMFMGF